MAKVRISNALGTSENEYSGDGLAIHVDGQMVFPVNGGANAQTPSKVGNVAPAPGSYESEVAQALLGKWTTDAQGRLVDHRTGKVTEATPDDPWPASVDSVEALLQFQFDHNNRPDQIYVDGVKFGQPGIDPGVRYSTATGEVLTLEFSPPIAQKIDLPAITATATDPQRVTVAPPAGHQTTLTLHGPTIVTLTDLKAPTVPGRMAFVRITDKAGQQMPTGMITVSGGVESMASAANGFDCQIAVGADVPGASINVPEGATVTVEALGLSSDVLMDYRSADW